MKQLLDRLLIFGVLAAMLLMLIFGVLHPKDVNYYENRTANQMPAFSLKAWLQGDYQDRLEDALSDQVPAAERMNRAYHQTVNRYLRAVQKRFSNVFHDRYFRFQDLLIFGDDYITFSAVWPEDRQTEIDAKAENLNAAFARHPELRFYVYYIEKDTDIEFDTGLKTGFSDCVMDALHLPDSQKGIFRVNSFDEFSQWFFRTDHHWNYAGSYRAYTELMALFGKSDLLVPSGPEFIAGGMCGTKARVVGADALFTEELYAYRYDFPEMRITINGEAAADYGRQSDTFTEADYGTMGYSSFYGDDYGEIIFQTDKTGAGNLLVIGESFDNALLKLLASSFENTYSIDLRNYERENGKVFSFSDYCAAHGITDVLLIGNMDYFVLEDFRLEDAP